MNWYDRLKATLKTKYAAEVSFLLAAGTVVLGKLTGEIPTWKVAAYYLLITVGGGAIGFRQRVTTGKLNTILATQAVQVAEDRRIPDDHPALPDEIRPFVAAAAVSSTVKPDAVSQRATNGGVPLPGGGR